jgi:hypothetical protein
VCVCELDFRLLSMGIKAQLSRLLLHKCLEASQCDDFPESYVNCLSARLHSQDSDRFVGQLGIEPYRNRRDCHRCFLPRTSIMSVLYVKFNQGQM